VVHMGVRQEDGVGPDAAEGGESLRSLPGAAGGIDEVGAVDAAQGRQQAHLDQIDQAGAGARGEKLFKVAGPGGEGCPEIEEDAGAAVFE